MDALAALLDGPRAQGAFLLRSNLEAPYGLRIADEAPLTLMAVVEGETWMLPDGLTARRLRAGDLAIFRGPDGYTVADDPGTVPQVAILPGQVCQVADGADPGLMRDLGLPGQRGVRAWGNSPDGATVLLTGTYQLPGEISGRLLAALPQVVVVTAEEWDRPLVPLLAAEMARDLPGQEAVLDRLLDLVLIAALRMWFARPDAPTPGWYRAHGDPVVGRALHLIHQDPAAPWTVAALAATIGISRAALARRFAELVGEPPMTYLTGWRLALAADLLLEPGTTIETVAGRVGYSSGFALSAAFKRVRGVSPQAHRAAAS